MNTAGGNQGDSDRALSESISALLSEAIDQGELPSASWLVKRRKRVLSQGAIGQAVIEPERVAATVDTIFDLASLTKPLVTTTLTLLAAKEGTIELDEPVRAYLSEIPSEHLLADATWRDLLSHRAGLEAWYPLYVAGRDRNAYLHAILARSPAYTPRTRALYSDLGFILLFIALERATGTSFEELFESKIRSPLALGRCGFRPGESLRRSIAATDRGNGKEREMARDIGLSFDGWREGVIRGEVNDGNAFYLGGVSGHAGLFGDATSVARLASVYTAENVLLDEQLKRDALTCQAESETDRRSLGWQLRTSSNPGAPLSASAFGHAGFPGVSVWVDPEIDTIIVFLTNRIHPRARESRIQELRRELNRLVATCTRD